jgi:hypothetical protein
MTDMAPRRHPHATLIDALGGPWKLARAMAREGVRRTPQGVSHWKRRGVPWRHRPLVARIARAMRLGRMLPADFLEGNGPALWDRQGRNRPGGERR